MVTKEYVLTVAQSKRLIAMGVAQYDAVRLAMAKGTIIVCPGTTNTYVLEELIGKSVKHFTFTMGLTLPAGVKCPDTPASDKLGYVVLRKGKWAKNVGIDEALKQLTSDDVVIKGANALNHRASVAGVLMGHPEGGTVGKVIGTVTARKAHFIIPVGLEKQISEPIIDAANVVHNAYDGKNAISSLCAITNAEIITEIEAVNLLADCYALQIAAGGILGAEGGVWLLVTGEPTNMKKLDGIVKKLANEPPFGANQ